jgi:hypothetical protein
VKAFGTLAADSLRRSAKPDSSPGPLWPRQVGMGFRERGHSSADAFADRAGSPGGGVDVDQHLLGGRHRVVVVIAQENVKEVQAFIVEAQYLCLDVDALAGYQLAEVREMRLGRVIAAAAVQVTGVDAN